MVVHETLKSETKTRPRLAVFKPDLTLNRQLRWYIGLFCQSLFDEPIMCNKAMNSCHNLKIDSKDNRMARLPNVTVQASHVLPAHHCTVVLARQPVIADPQRTLLCWTSPGRSVTWPSVVLCIKFLSVWRPDRRTVVSYRARSSMTLSSQSITQRLILVHNL